MQWKNQLLERAGKVFDDEVLAKNGAPGVKELHAKIGQQALEFDF